MDEDNPDEREMLRRARRKRAAEASYPVGYSKPRKDTQFQPGHTLSSGPRKPKEPKPPPLSPTELLAKIAGETTFIVKDGQKEPMELGEAIIRRILFDAAKGNPRAVALYFKAHSEVAKDVVAQEQAHPDYEPLVRAMIEKMASRREQREEEARKRAEASQAPPAPEDGKK
jgi:hypothetical protein